MPGERMLNGWTVTNAVEQHFRVSGRIMGKIHKPARETCWSALAYTVLYGRRFSVFAGFRRDPGKARELVEKALVDDGVLL